jgi:hypothetical protein
MFDLLTKLVQVLAPSTALLLAVTGVIVTLLTYLRRGRLKFGNFQLEFPREIRREIERIETQLPQVSETVKPIDRQYALFREYHAQGLAQSRVSFWFSLIFASLGFLVIITTLLAMDRSRTLMDQGTTFVSLVAGTIIDAVSALFFVQSNKARHLMTEFFDRLRTDRKFEESLQLAESIPDPAAQSRLKALLAVEFAGIEANETTLRELFGSNQDGARLQPTPPGDLGTPRIGTKSPDVQMPGPAQA